MYEEGSGRVEKEFDVLRILEKLKNLDLLMKTFCTTPEQRNAVQFHARKVIDIDKSTSEEEVETKPKDKPASTLLSAQTKSGTRSNIVQPVPN